MLRRSVALLTLCLLGAALAAAVRQSRILHQMQTDPEVATVWLAQVTHGPNHTLIRGSTVQRWANEHGVHALGDYQVLTGSFNGEPNGIEFWFDYDSHLSSKDLECHRVGQTAFVDDLGQIYHGFLDFQGKTVGVYLPGYDHAAHSLTCTLHWMPRRPAAPFPVSRPMTFQVPLPSLRRTLPPASTLPAGPVSVTKNGVTVTIGDMHLSPPQLRTLYQGQRDLMFRLQIQGGQIADDNVAFAPPALSRLVTWPYKYRMQPRNNFVLSSVGTNFAITDPYGTNLLPETATITIPPTNPHAGKDQSLAWIAPVNGAGRGTDCVRLHFHIQPPSRSPKAIPPDTVAFDIPVRIAP